MQHGVNIFPNVKGEAPPPESDGAKTQKGKYRNFEQASHRMKVLDQKQEHDGNAGVILLRQGCLIGCGVYMNGRTFISTTREWIVRNSLSVGLEKNIDPEGIAECFGVEEGLRSLRDRSVLRMFSGGAGTPGC